MEQQIIENGGLQYVPQIAVQYVYLDFDGELTSYNGEILTVDNVEVKDSELSEERIQKILAELNAKYASQHVIFVTDRPIAVEYSTIYIGKTDAFNQYGNFAGLAETIDEGNQNSTDKAFVMLDAADSNESIISTISHETDHLLGTLDHGGDGITAYAHYYCYNQTFTGQLSYAKRIYLEYSDSINHQDKDCGCDYVDYYYQKALNVAIRGESAGIHVSSGGIAINTELFNGSLIVFSGGVAENTTVKEFGRMIISSGGIARSVTIDAIGVERHLAIHPHGVGNDITAYDGEIILYEKCKVTNLKASSEVTLSIYIEPDSYATGSYDGHTFEMKNGTMSGLYLGAGCSAYLGNGGVANNTFIGSRGGVWVTTDGTANRATILVGGTMDVARGGVANSTTVNSGGRMYVSSGGVANSTTVNSGGGMGVASGGVANSTTVNSGGLMGAASGGVANSTTVNSGGRMYVSSGGTATNIIASSGARLDICVALNTYIQGTYAGASFEMKDAQISGYTVNSGGSMCVSSGGVANSTTVNSGGRMDVASGGVANSTTVNSGGDMYVSSIVTDIKTAGHVYVSHNGNLSGEVLLCGTNGSIGFGNYSNISEVNITVEMGQRDWYLSNKGYFSIITGLDYATDANITINVKNDLQIGTYNLANTVSAYNKNIVLNVNNIYQGMYVWNSSIGNYEFKGRANEYKLQKDGNLLKFTYDGIKIIDFETLKLAVSANWESYALEAKVDDFKAEWGKQTNKRSWARIEVSDLVFKANGVVNGYINIHCKGKISGTMGILTVNGDLSGENQGLFLTISQDNEGEWQYTDWDLVGKLSVSIQKVDRRCAFKFGNKAFNTKELSGTLDINTKDGVYTITVDWERSAWKNFGSIQGQAVLKECTVNNEDQLDLSRVEISFQDKERNRIDPNIHFYSISGEFVNLASADTEPAYFKGTIGLTWMAATIKVGQSGWLKKILTESGISSNNSNTLTLSVVDTVFSVKMDTKNNFDASCIVNLLNIGEKSIGTIKGDLVYLSDTDSIRVTGQLDFAGIIGSDCVVIVENGTFRAESYAKVKLPAWAEWITDGEITGQIAMFSNGADTTIAIWGEITSRSGYKSIQGRKYNFSTGKIVKLDNTETIDALYDEGADILWRGNILAEQYSIVNSAQNDTERLVFEGDYSRGESVQICISNEKSGESFCYSLSSDKKNLNSAATMSLSTQLGTIAQLLVFNENGFAVALQNYSAGIWKISVWDDNSDLHDVDLWLNKEVSQTCAIKNFSVANITEFSADISYSVTGWEENTKIELFCRSLQNHSEIYLLAELPPGENQSYKWRQDRILNPGNYEFFIRVSGDIIPIESDGAGKFSISGEAEPVLLYDSIIYNGKATQIIPVFSKQYTRKEYSLNGTDYFEIADETSLIFDSSIKIYFRGYDESSDEYSDIYCHTLESKVNAGLFIWESTVEDPNYVLRISNSNKAGDIYISTKLSAIDFIGFREQIYGAVQLRNSGVWTSFNGTEISMTNISPQYLLAPQDNKLDLFAAYGKGIWKKNYVAQHSGILNGWNGTEEKVALTGKNKIADVFVGSSDSNVLVMTDDTNGDALFVDDIYTAWPGTVAEQQARIAQIDEIRAGVGDDIVDMTSQRFAYIGDGVKIYGGNGNDIIWANNGSNTLFGDAGNDRLVGGADNDVIVGGIGNDSMHGGGGNDTFTFGNNWGVDTVEQLAGGSVTLWFEFGSASNWNASTLSYTDGTNTVKVSGVDTVTLKFGADVSLPDGCFADAVSEKIFEDKNSGMLA